jgi:hypothetical protein
MKNNMTNCPRTSRTSGFLSALTGLALLAAAGSPALAGNGNVGNSNIMPPQSNPYGLSYPEWAESYWQWAHAGGTADSPQAGPVWFLASAPFQPPGGTPTVRNITIPAGTSLFSPVLSYFNNNEGVDPPLSGEELLADANDVWDAVAVLTASIIDGEPVKGLENPQETAYRLETGVYPLLLADGSITDEVAVGVFLMIKPLPVGQHTVRLVGAIDVGILLTKDVTYNITVTP